tara:strand:+ start:300 stop:809 length:510 start_codon:yes stop_codon:yes gene_type:complete
MRNYELALIINPDLASRFNPYKEHLESVLSELNFKNAYCENVGIRELAYPINEFSKGHYLIYQLQGNPEKINDLESKLKYDNSVLRHLLISVDQINSSDSFLTQDTRDSKKLAEDRAHEAKLKNETSINADSDNSQTKSKDSSNLNESKETVENDQVEATENNDAKDES